MKTKQVRCQSGLMGERSKLRSRYDNLEDFRNWSDIYGLTEKLGFDSADEAWQTNPLVESSVEPSDFRVIT